MAGMGEIVEEPKTSVVDDDTIYVSVTKDLKESKSNLTWAIQNIGGNKICILHVHVPATMIPLMGTKFPASSLKEQEVEAYRKLERQNMHKNLNEYLLLCSRMGVRAEKLHLEIESIEKGILELVSRHGIRKLVMGAASDNRHSRKMMDLKSKKAIYVSKHAPAYCQIRFVCKGRLIHTRNRCLDDGNEEAASPLPQQRPNPEAVHSLQLRSQSVTMWQNNREKLEILPRARSAISGHEGITVTFSSPDPEGFSSPSNRWGTEVNTNGSDGVLRKSPSVFSTCSENALTPKLIFENVIDSSEFSPVIASLRLSSPPSVLDGGMDESLYYHLQQAVSEAENAILEAFQETLKRRKAENDALDAMRRAKASESLYKEVLKQRKQADEELEKERGELERMKRERDEVKEELRLAQDQKLSLERQIESSEFMVRELEQKIISVVDLLTMYKKERDELQMQRNDALKEAEELRKKQGEVSRIRGPVESFSDFSFQEIEQATRNFNSSLKIGEGGYGNIYKATLRQTEVAIKMLHANNNSQGPAEFMQEVDVLSKLRHPNLVTLIGACPESWTLVYEYLPNGSLEDRLNCKDNTAPLSWQTRIRIAAELCSALIFLHCCKPHAIVHGDLKPSNVLLDANFVSKLSDFGICRILSNTETSGGGDDATDCWRTVPKGTLAYMDPEFLVTGYLTPKSDVYSFGIILLRLLTGRPALGITKEAQYALDTGKFKSLLDPLAGDWPFVQAQQLARVALRCCELARKNRPDIRSDVWKILEAMSAFSGGTDSFKLAYGGSEQPPSSFICPIFQEMMLDPHIAADGFSYEGEAVRGWLDSGHDTSPMTNEKLQHRNIAPNHTLRSAIQDWLQHHH